jgi:hypothetical protein
MVATQLVGGSIGPRSRHSVYDGVATLPERTTCFACLSGFGEAG